MINLLELNKAETRYNLVTDDRVKLQQSEARNLLVFKIGTTDLEITSGNSAAITIEHNLGYVPVVQAYHTIDADGETYNVIPFADVIAELFYFTIKVDITDTTCTFSMLAVDPLGFLSFVGLTATIKYYIFRERVSS